MYQHTVIVGHTGRDAEMRYTPTGVPVTDFSLATTRRWTNANGETQEKTTWWKIICWRKMAEIAAQYIRKGKLILVEGEVEASAFTGKDGEARATLELTANNFKFLGGRRDNGEGEGETGPSVPVGRTDEIGGDSEIPF
jgi:single-strand DNA-binding protein